MIQNLGKYAHAPKAKHSALGGSIGPHGSSMQQGRHAAGAPIGKAPGNKGSQAAPAGNSPTTGAPTQMKPVAPSTSDNRSVQGAQWAGRPPAPFGGPNSAVNAPVAPAPRGVSPGTVQSNQYAGKTGSRAPANPPAGPVGGMKPTTLNKTVGVTFPGKRKVGKINANARGASQRSMLYGD